MTKLIKYQILALILVVNNISSAQDIKTLQETFLEAEYFFMSGDYSDALPYYLKLSEQMPGNANLAYRTGICYLNIPSENDLAVSYLEKASSKMSAKHKEGTVTEESAPYDALYQLGVSYRISHQFDKAKEAFSRYRKTLLPDDTVNISFIDHEIKTCDNAVKMMAIPVKYTLENLGPSINNERDNFNPVVSPDGNTMIYMTSLAFYDAIMYTVKTDGKWSEPRNIVPELQVDEGVFVSSLSEDGRILFLSQDDNYNSDIYSSELRNGNWSKVVRLNKNINTKYWESHGFISEDGKTLVFASDRPGGYGGLDIYISRKKNGDWGPAENLGPVINSFLNEDRPSIIENGKTLFFASQDHNSMGGYDIFRSDLQSSGNWSAPVNLGYPFNDTGDNILFMPEKNGKAGYISIEGKEDGLGGRDIYHVTFK